MGQTARQKTPLPGHCSEIPIVLYGTKSGTRNQKRRKRPPPFCFSLSVFGYTAHLVLIWDMLTTEQPSLESSILMEPRLELTHAYSYPLALREMRKKKEQNKKPSRVLDLDDLMGPWGGGGLMLDQKNSLSSITTAKSSTDSIVSTVHTAKIAAREDLETKRDS